MTQSMDDVQANAVRVKSLWAIAGMDVSLKEKENMSERKYVSVIRLKGKAGNVYYAKKLNGILEKKRGKQITAGKQDKG